MRRSARGISRPIRAIAGARAWFAAACGLGPLITGCGAARHSTPPPALAPLAGLDEDRARVAQLVSHASQDGTFLRTPSTALGTLPSSGLRIVAPAVTAVYGSALPYGPNLGNLWAGRGTSVLARAGVWFAGGPLVIVLAPEFAHTENRAFEVLPGAAPDRSAFASPWHVGALSADLPLRFGTGPLDLVLPGQSSLTVTTGPVAFGMSTEEQWWGPGIRNALVLSNNAGSVPHAFLRTGRPIATPFGVLEGRWIVGALTESTFFDTLASNDTRSLSAIALTWRPAAAPNVTLGAAHAVLRTSPRGRVSPARLFDALGLWDGGVPIDTGAAPLAAPAPTSTSDGLLGVWARWVLPSDGLELYAEGVRAGVPRHLREWLLLPQAGFGYTLGTQWAGAADARGRRLRFQWEASSIEQTANFSGHVLPDLYTGTSAPQGFTQRGRVLGAATGPGSSTQFAGVDWLAPWWQIGMTATRVRWENDAMYRQPAANFFRHDVSLLLGLRGAVLTPWVSVAGTIEAGRRDNYLFQNGFNNPGGFRTVDVPMTSVRLSVTPRR